MGMSSDRLAGVVAVVVGGGGTIGSAVAERISSDGATVVVASRNVDALSDVAMQISAATGGDVHATGVDVTDEESVIKLAAETVERFGHVDVLVTAHGVTTKLPAIEFDAKTWDHIFALNVTGVMLLCREFAKHMIARGQGGKIINLSSVRGARATLWGGNLGYCASKGAVDMMTKMLASEWAEHGITVNAVAPALVAESDTWAQRPQEVLDRYLANIPLKRVASPQDTAGIFAFLASSAADYLTGQIIFVDGGLTAVA